MKKTLILVGAIFTLVLIALQSEAIPWYDPPWDATYPTATYQQWEFSLPDNPALPEIIDNPYGPGTEPAASLEIMGSDDWRPDWDGPTGDPVPGWHIDDPAGGGVWIHIFNEPDPNLWKLIFVQVTSTKAPGNISTSPGGSVSFPFPQIQHTNASGQFTGWYTYPFLITIPENPPEEWIHIDFPYSTIIDEIVVDTICIPEPSLAVLALAGMFMLRKRG